MTLTDPASKFFPHYRLRSLGHQKKLSGWIGEGWCHHVTAKSGVMQNHFLGQSKSAKNHQADLTSGRGLKAFQHGFRQDDGMKCFHVSQKLAGILTAHEVSRLVVLFDTLCNKKKTAPEGGIHDTEYLIPIPISERTADNRYPHR